ncbi:MAG: hypothetical protein IJA62_01445 [Ruminococcus sp.]|nr:hypothetical protein [Ruminococcus sp.]
MKKIFSILMASLILALSLCAFVPSISAAQEDWVLGPYAEYITHSGKTYYHLNTPFSLDYEFDHRVIDLEFSDEKTEEKFEGSHISVFGRAVDILIEVELYRMGYYSETRVYIEESHLQEYKDITRGVANKYSIWNYYGYNKFEFTDADYKGWLQGGTVTMDASKVYNYDLYNVCAVDDTLLFNSECALILHDYYSDELFLLSYGDYDSRYFYGDGSFNAEGGKEVTVYTLEDEKLRNELTTFVNTEPEDELGWLVVEKVNETAALTFCGVVFGVLPLGLLVFSVVMLFFIKDKKYIRPYVVMAAGSLLVILAFLALFVILI